MTQRPSSRRPQSYPRQPAARRSPSPNQIPNGSSGINRRELLSAGAGAVVAAGVGAVAWNTGLGSMWGDKKSVAVPSSPTPSPTSALSTPASSPRIVIPPTEEPEPTATVEPQTPAEDMIKETSIAEIRRGYDSGWFTAEEYTQATLDRISLMDQRGPELNAVIELNPEALEIARELDQEAQNGRRRSPIHGIPVLVKDIFATNDAMRTTSGSLSLADNEVMRDAFMIEALRDAGAIILGKTNMTEFSNFRGGTPNGWSSRGGQTVNPNVLSYSAWGSSTGSAVSVAASYVPFAIGTETNGSILCPASACGVVGLKPTVGLVSRSGSMGVSFIQDSPGPMGRTVEDVAYALSAMVGYDPEDMAYGQFAEFAPAARFDEFPVPNVGERDYTRGLDPDGLRGARIGVCRSMFGFDPVADAHAEIALDALREAGAEVIDEIWMDAVGAVEQNHNEGEMLIIEFGWLFQHYIDMCSPGGPITLLADVINFNYEHANETLEYGDQSGLEAALYAASIDDPWFTQLVSENTSITRDWGIDFIMDEYELDALVAPSSGMPTSLDIDALRGSSAKIPSMAGYPSLTLPIGYTDGLPAGLHFFGRAFSERTLLNLAYGLEQTMQARRVPEYLDEPLNGGVNLEVPSEEESPWDPFPDDVLDDATSGG